VTSRVSSAERLRVEIDEVFAGSGDLAGGVEQVARLGAQLLLQAALEAEVSEFLGRERYARQAGTEQAREGMRNGYCPTTIKTTAGPVTLERSKLRGTTERFASQLFSTGVLRTNALEALVIASFVRGLSVRDVEATLTEALGADATVSKSAVSKSAVSRICSELKEQYATWSRRRLDDVTLDYLFLDASHFTYHPNAGAEPVLAAWDIDTDGKPVFVGLDTAATESGDAWAGFLTDLGERGLTCPLLVISDGAPGLIAAAEQTMSAALRQRCLIHRARNILAKVPPTRSEQSRPTTGRSSTCLTPSNPAWTRWPWCTSASTRWRCAGATPTRPRSAACSPTATASRSTCVSPVSTGPGSGTPTSSNGPSDRPAAGSKSSAGSPASTRSPAWSGPCWTGRRPAGGASP